MWMALLALLLLPDANSFTGYLERVGNGTISIRLADRRVIDAMVSDDTAIAEKYAYGDHLEMNCKSITPVWDDSITRYQYLEVTSLRLVRHPSADELEKMLDTLPFREGKNLLKRARPTSPAPIADNIDAPGGHQLAHARTVNLEYASHMPNFVADEKAKRYRIGPRAKGWSDYDTIESEITFRGNHAARQRITRNGKDWDQPFEALPGFKWYEGFGTEITPLFDPKCPTKIDYQGTSKKDGRVLLDYRFNAAIDSCFPLFFFDYQRFNPARTGHVFVDEPNGNIIQLDERAIEFPQEMQFIEREEHITWDYVKIGEESHLLPVRARFQVRYVDGTQYRIEVEYRNHRHFEASSSVVFK